MVLEKIHFLLKTEEDLKFNKPITIKFNSEIGRIKV